MTRFIGAGLGLLLLAGCGAPSAVEPYPGEPWVDAVGETVPPEEVALYADDCPGRESAAFLEVRWPLVPVPGVEEERRLYVRDPESVMPTTRLLAPYDRASALPRGARFAGLTSGPFQLWAAADDAIYLYLVDGTRVEALPRALDDQLSCP